MSDIVVAFDDPHLAVRVEAFSHEVIDGLPFGVIRIDRHGLVEFYNEAEARLSGYGKSAVGRNLFQVSACFGGDHFQQRLRTSIEETGDVDLEFGWRGDFNDPCREMRIRVQSARSGALWIFIQRDGDPDTVRIAD